MKTTPSEKLDKALYAAGICKFECKSSDETCNAQRNLEGRTHYVDADTLQYFKTRILRAWAAKDGLVFCLVESVSSRPNHGGCNKRAVIFDVFGAVLNEREIWHKKTDKAEKEISDFLASFDAVKYTTENLKTRAKREIEQAERTLAALAGK